VPAIQQPVRRLVGWACVVAGVVVLLLGYAGVTGTSLVAKQLPYLISGGLFGVALVVVGSALIGRRSSGKGGDRLDQVERALNEVTAVLITRHRPPGTSGPER
jgi:hypothetical protein